MDRARIPGLRCRPAPPQVKGNCVDTAAIKIYTKDHIYCLAYFGREIKTYQGDVEMGNLFIAVGLFYGVALLIQALFYTQCAKKALLEKGCH